MNQQKAGLQIKQSQWLFLLINLLTVGFLVTIHIRLYQYAFDDAYIHFRVAHNLVETGTPYFNADMPLKVSTASGWVIFLSILYAAAKVIHLQSSFPLLISLINALITTCVAITYSRIIEVLRGIQLKLLEKLVLYIIVFAVLLPSSIGLMETPFALLMAGLGLYLLIISKPYSFTLLGLAAFVRLELSVLLVLLGIFIIFKRKFFIHQVIAYFSLGVFPVVLFDLFFYHTLVPHSIIAKSAIYSLTPMSSLIKLLLRSMPASSILPSIGLAGFVILVLVLCWVVFRESIAPPIRAYPALLYCSGVLIACIYIVGHSLLFDWYIPLYVLPIAIALVLCSFLTQYPKNLIPSALLCFFVFLSAVSLGQTVYSAFYKPNLFDLFESGSRVKIYLTVGKIINEDYPNATLLTSEVGGLGYSFNGQIFDAVGLASSDALFFHPMSVPQDRSSGEYGAIPPGYVKLTNPDIIISYDIFAEALLRDHICDQYNIITVPAYLPKDAKYAESKTLWGSEFVRIYIRKNLPVSSRICDLSAASDDPLNAVCSDDLGY